MTIHAETGSLVNIHRDSNGLSIQGQSRGLHERWLLVICQCCHQDFYTDRDDRENYCPRCMAVGR